MNNRGLQNIAWLIMLLGFFVSFFFICSTIYDGYSVVGERKIDFAVTGQFGDFIGGFVGTIISGAGFIFLYLTLKEQRENFNKERFESNFFEMIKIHRENVSSLKYSKYYKTDNNISENKKVIRVIFQEFVECYREVKKFSNSKNVNDYILPDYQNKLNKIIQPINPKINLIELAIIDISFSIVFFGAGFEGNVVLRNRFSKRYNNSYYYRLLKYIQIKPKEENDVRFKLWKNVRSLELSKLRPLIDEVYSHRNGITLQSTISSQARELLSDNSYDKYYGGHQHRLGHYYRHLYQSYKYLNSQTSLTLDEKYFYGKLFRAQLSTYEQALLFINSISSLGMRWEYSPELDKGLFGKDLITQIADRKLITKYQLIKNLPGSHFIGIEYSKYYPNINYEANEF